MMPFLRNTTFVGVNMAAIYNDNIPLSARLMDAVIQYQKEGVVKSLQPVTAMSFSQIEEAFRTMQTGKHIGKIVLSPSDEDLVSVSVERRSDPLNRFLYWRLVGLF